MSPAAQDPYKNFNFLVEIDGLTAAAFSEVSGLTAETGVIEYRTGDMRGAVRKLPGIRKYANLVLKRGMTSNLELWAWFKTVLDGQVPPDRRSGAVVLLDDEGREVLRWQFIRAWPCKYEGPTLNAKGGGDVAIETLELAHEGLSLVGSPGE